MIGLLSATILTVGGGMLVFGSAWLNTQDRSLQTPPVEITIRDSFDVPAADAQSEAIVAAASTFLDTRGPEQRSRYGQRQRNKRHEPQ